MGGGRGVYQAERAALVQFSELHRSKRRRAGYFLKRLSKAARASLGLRGVGVEAAITGPLLAGAASRATVTRGLNNWQSFVWSLRGIRTGMGFRHWKRVDGSKCA